MIVKKKTNKELMEDVLDLIKSYGFHITDKILGNCYFIFEGEEDSICHFHIKEIPGFKFGIWNTCRFDSIETQLKDDGIGNTWADRLEISPLSELVFFTQYERDIDKFKPSRSGFVAGLYRRCWETLDKNNKKQYKEEWYDYDLKSILNFIKKHPIRSVEYSNMETRRIWDYNGSNISLFFKWIKDWYYYIKYRLRDYIHLKKHILVTKQLTKKLKASYAYVIDRGECWIPRIDIFIRRKPNVSMEIWYKDLDLIEKFNDKWFNKISVTQMDRDVFALDLTEEDILKDKELYLNFKELLDKYEKGETDTKIVYKNIE